MRTHLLDQGNASSNCWPASHVAPTTGVALRPGGEPTTHQGRSRRSTGTRRSVRSPRGERRPEAGHRHPGLRTRHHRLTPTPEVARQYGPLTTGVRNDDGFRPPPRLGSGQAGVMWVERFSRPWGKRVRPRSWAGGGGSLGGAVRDQAGDRAVCLGVVLTAPSPALQGAPLTQLGIGVFDGDPPGGLAALGLPPAVLFGDRSFVEVLRLAGRSAHLGGELVGPGSLRPPRLSPVGGAGTARRCPRCALPSGRASGLASPPRTIGSVLRHG